MAAKKPQSKPREPWERQENESAVAYEAFAVYRDMGADRSYVKVSQKLVKSRTIIDRWGRLHDWIERVEYWDIEQDRLLLQAMERDRIKMRKLHADISRAMLLKGVSQLNSALSNSKTAQRDAVAMIESGIKNERLARGEVDIKTENKHEIAGSVTVNTSIDFRKLSDEELDLLAELADKLAAE